MQLLVLIVKKSERIKKLIQALARAGIRGGTIVEATGMAESLMQMEDLPVFGTLRRMLSVEDYETSEIMLFVLKEEQLKTVTRVVKEVIGDLGRPNTGIMFAIPLSYVDGIN